MDNNTKAKLGKARFLELSSAFDATSERVRQWLAERGLEAGRREWAEVRVAPDIEPRYVNLAYTTRCIDAFLKARVPQLAWVLGAGVARNRCSARFRFGGAGD
jgi:hypothetical protein